MVAQMRRVRGWSVRMAGNSCCGGTEEAEGDFRKGRGVRVKQRQWRPEVVSRGSTGEVGGGGDVCGEEVEGAGKVAGRGAGRTGGEGGGLDC